MRLLIFPVLGKFPCRLPCLCVSHKITCAFLFPLNCPRGLLRNIINDPVYMRNFIYDPV